MIARILFIIILIAAIIALIVTAAFTTLSSVDTYHSPEYMTDTNVRSSTEYMAFAAGISWTVLALLILIGIYGYLSGSFTATFTEIYNDDYYHTMDYVYITTFIFFILAILIVVALAVISLTYLNKVVDRSGQIAAAHTATIVAIISSSILFFLLIVAAVSYFIIKNNRYDAVVGHIIDNMENPIS